MTNMLPIVTRKYWRRMLLDKCKYCWMPFPRFGQLLSHLSRHGNEGPHVCIKCRKVFHSLIVYQRHRRVFHGEQRPLEFEVCDLRSAFRAALSQRFIRRKTDQGLLAPAAMQNLGVRLKRIEPRIHRLTATPRKRGVRIAAKSRSTFSAAAGSKTETANLSDMVEVERGKARTYSCPCCSKTFPIIHQLKEHVRTHDDDRPHRCTKCHKRYKNVSHLTVHVRTVHEGRRPYRCAECDKAFSRRSHLTAHGVTHSAERRFECCVCRRRFAHRFQLTAHEPVHSGERRHRCTYCQKEFLRSGDLTRHTLLHMGLGRRQRVAASNGSSSPAKPSSNQLTETKAQRSRAARSEVC